MDVPPEKRPRLSGPNHTQWHNPPETSRQLPPPPPSGPPLQLHQTPFSRPPDTLPLDLRRPPEHQHQQQQPPPPPLYDHQDLRRPSSGPSHGYPNGPPPPPTYAGQRDPMVKRDSSDEPPQQYRPPSTGLDHNVMPSPHAEGPGRPYHPPFDPTRNQQYPPYQPVQSPMSVPEPFLNPYSAPGHPPPPGPPREAQYPTVSYPSAPRQDSNHVRKKAQRAAQACDSCRTLKAKCDEGRPSCSTCREKGSECHYRDPPPKQQDKGTSDILEMLHLLKRDNEDGLSRLESTIKRLEQRVNMMPVHQSYDYRVEYKPEPEERKIRLAPTVMSQPPAPFDRRPNESPYSSTPSQSMALDRLINNADDTSEDEDTGNPGPAKPSTIPVNHTTGNAELLNVPAIEELCKDAMSKIKHAKYPILQEEKRGLLSLYGRGEGYEQSVGNEKDPVPEYTDGALGDAHSDVSSPACDEWGQLGGLTPPQQPDLVRGNVGSDGMPDLSRETVERLVRSYLENMNNMHPILIPARLRTMVEQFLRSIPEGLGRPKHVINLVGGHTSHPGPGFVASYKTPESPGNKRKRSPVSVEHVPELPPRLDFKPGHPFRTISSAILLLVMALGEICMYKDKIPDVTLAGRDWDHAYISSPTTRHGHPPSPMQSSPSMTSSMGRTSPHPYDGDRRRPRSRRTSVDGHYHLRGVSAKARNIDLIPGLAYHALATDVIGNQLGGNSLQHVHANLLAGLYHGQLARVMESHGHIAAASRALQVILRPKLARLAKTKQDNGIVYHKDNPLVIAFWTCLQLESDLLAELPCPHSGILTYEEDMPLPNATAMVEEDKFDRRAMQSYNAQLVLRKHLNGLHNMFYKPETELAPHLAASSHPLKYLTIEASIEGLKDYMRVFQYFQWDMDKGEPADDILDARLRAKYYGAVVITYRPFVLQVLRHGSGTSNRLTGEYLPAIEAPVIDKNAKGVEDIEPKTLEYAEEGIKALIHSTRAFYGLGDLGQQRLIVTNVWGTAHAQWGNVMTLQAAYVNHILRPILLRNISEDGLRIISEKTMAFLALNSTSTSALNSDLKLLRAVCNKTGIGATYGPYAPHSSFSFSS
ncbi:hypothetical protein QTJ16_005455 [Diplocarpon rosae]|uniref:Zn(2)-C6 fungal-type domain-containing protein n=1 Tax=Diplocarpon rosae TaxID=946125 RepID=A0AAD9SWK4_9HELO|nr:hypothetical protein QTJ16_005455 [Diplocarpon rosae]